MKKILAYILSRMPRIRRTQDWEKAFGKWIVSQGASADITDTFGRAISYWLWRCGIPAKIAFWGGELPQTDISDLLGL